MVKDEDGSRDLKKKENLEDSLDEPSPEASEAKIVVKESDIKEIETKPASDVSSMVDTVEEVLPEPEVGPVSDDGLTSINISTSLGAYAGQIQRVSLEDSVRGEPDLSVDSKDSLYDEENEIGGRDFYDEVGNDSGISDFYSAGGSTGSDIYAEAGRDIYAEAGRGGPYQTGSDNGGSKMYATPSIDSRVDSDGLRHGNESRLEIEGLRRGFGVTMENNSKRDKRDNKYK